MVRRFQIPLQTILAIAVIIVSAWLLFFRLDHYGLWDDEAYTALGAKGVLRTGDTTAVIDHNIVAYRGGILLKDLRDRATAPLPAYLAAASIKVSGEKALAVRIPFAICGLVCVALIAWWISGRASLVMQATLAVALLCNVSFFLYCRQARYYAPAILFSVAAVYLYLNRNTNRSRLLILALVSICLISTNYLSYVALYCCLAVDYLVWGRREKPLEFREISLLLIPQVAFGAILSLRWNPFQTQFGGSVAENSFTDRVLLFLMNLRDLNRAEFIVAGVLLLAPIVGLIFRQQWLLRGSVALLLYVAVVSAFSPQSIKSAVFADVRYLVPVIPLAVALEALTIRQLTKRKAWLALPIALLVFGTNVFHGGFLMREGLRSTIASFIDELSNPPSDPYRFVASWIRQNVKPRESVWVLPDYMAYPLMFHAPEPVYAWQLTMPPQPQFRGLPAIHFQGQVPPKYIIAFGPIVQQIFGALRNWDRADAEYEHIATIDHFWKDLHRPELFWRTFKPVTDYDRNREAIYIFKNKW